MSSVPVIVDIHLLIHNALKFKKNHGEMHRPYVHGCLGILITLRMYHFSQGAQCPFLERIPLGSLQAGKPGSVFYDHMRVFCLLWSFVLQT